LQLRWTSEPPSLERLAAILKLATFYQIEDGRDFAISTLHMRTDLHPAMRLYLARSYHVAEWIHPRFKQLISTPTLSLTDDDIKYIGLETFITLTRTKTQIDLHRLECALKAPPVSHAIDCLDDQDCEKAWQSAWWGEPGRPGVAIALIHPHHPVSGENILKKLTTLKVSWNMDDNCRDLTVSKVHGSHRVQSPLLLENEYVDEAVVKLTAMYGC
jgi:hypothetical protein